MSGFLSGRIAEELAFYRIRETVASYAKTEEGRAAVCGREPCDDTVRMERQKTLGREWRLYLGAQKKDALSFVPCVKPLFPLLGTEGASLTEEQLLSLGQLCACATGLQKAVASAGGELPIPELMRLCHDMPSLEEPRRIIFSVIDADGTMRDLPELAELRADILRAQREIDAAIKRYTADPSLNPSLQTNVPALRSGRQLLAVRADRRGDIHGIVHEVSASGQTLFIEPEEAVRANNELVQAQFKLQAEIRKILVRTTAELSPYADSFAAAHDTLILLDGAWAAAKWCDVTGGIFAERCREGEPLSLVQARHPLLGKSAVPIDVQFREGKNVLLITGPNTGGKTVTLKTVALFALLNQAGFPVPADEGTRLPVFSSVFADIGDEQSIDESLSTFSSHMRNMAQMLEHADSRSLVLLDELGSGTDPQEGGAIAMAALDTLISRDALVLVTTHHGILKHYGYTRPQCINASVTFDSDTLRPTYRLVMGVPGESHALDIALRSGLPQTVVEAARKYMEGNEADVSGLIKGLAQKHAELDALIAVQQEKELQLEEKRLKLMEREADAKERELKLKEEENRESSAFVRETRSRLENLVRELREGEITKEKTRAVRSFLDGITEEAARKEDDIAALEKEQSDMKRELSELRETVLANGMRLSAKGSHKAGGGKKTRRRLSNAEALAKASVPEQTKAREKSRARRTFAPGEEVVSVTTRAKGTLVAEVKPGQWTVQFGSVRMTVPQDKLELTESVRKDAETGATVIIEKAPGAAAEKPAFELRLMGMRSAEALRVLEHQLDLCTVSSFRHFSVIHGKGNGILQQAVHDYLSHAPEVRSFTFAPPEDGGTGKTYVELF